MKITSLLAAAGATLLLGLAASAYEFQPVGNASIAMGGAGVASASGSMVGYYNPALLTNTKGMEISATAGVGIDDKGLADNLRILSDLKLTDTLNNMQAEIAAQGLAFNGFTAGTQATIDQAHDVVVSMKGGSNSIKLQPNAGVGVQLGGLAVGVFGTSDESVKINIVGGTDLLFKNANVSYGGGNYDVYYNYNSKTNGLSFNAYIAGTTTPVVPPPGFSPATYDPTISAATYADVSLYDGVKTHKDSILLSGFAITEIPISLATAFNFPLVGKLSVGASVKPMTGYSYADNVNMDTKIADLQDRFTSKQTTSTALGVDLGATMDAPLIPMIKLGFVAKNINKPEFKDSNNISTFKLDPLYRCGAALELVKGINIAADYDLSVNKDADGNPSRYLGGGISFDGGGFLSLRGGAMQNVGIDGSNLLYTAGFGIGLKYLNLNAAAVWDSKNNTSYNGKDYPNPAKINVALVSRW